MDLYAVIVPVVAVGAVVVLVVLKMALRDSVSLGKIEQKS